MSKYVNPYVLVEDAGGDAAALYDVASATLVKAGHVDDVREHLIDLLEKAGVLTVHQTPTMPEGEFKFANTYPDLYAFEASRKEN